MQITLPTLDTEQSDALAQLVSEYNASAKSVLSAEEYCALVLLGSINARKMSNIDARGRQLIEAAKSLPDDKRIQFTNETAQLLQTIAAE